jgi:predicted heme/steroid binding protein
MKQTGILGCGILLVLVCLALLGCGQGGSGPVDSTSQATANSVTVSTEAGSSTTVPPESGKGEKTFTLAELAQYDGKNGNPAYVAVDGAVYDVSGSALWPQGEHTSCNLGAAAGKDLSETIKQAPARMRARIEAMPVVGKLAQ